MTDARQGLIPRRPDQDEQIAGWETGYHWAESSSEPEELERFERVSISDGEDAETAFRTAVDPDALLHDAVEDWFGRFDVSPAFLRGYILGVQCFLTRRRLLSN